MNKFIIVFLVSFASIFSQSTIVINEIVSSNSVFLDEDNETPDWIEIFNASEITVNLLNYSLSDNEDNPRKWLFPDITIGPAEYLVIFASGKERYGPELHTDFSIKADGEILILTNSDEQIIDQVEPTEIISDYSLGRSLTNISEWLFFPIPTPGAANDTEGYNAISESPIFSVNGGFYTNSVSLELSTFSGSGAVYYTIDGSEPSVNSTQYLSPITLDSTTVLRARTFSNNLLPSKIITSSYFINENVSLPVVSLSTDPDNFFDDEIGIYVEGTGDIPNYDQDWERPLHVELFEQDGNLGFSIDAGVTIHGGSTRSFAQKSLAIIARGKYGSSIVPYQLFPELPFAEYNSFLLRMSGDDNLRTHFRDGMMQSLVNNLDLETQAFRPAIVFLNGDYWGVYNIRERNTEDYIAQHNNVDPNNLDILTFEHKVVEGDDVHYMSLYEFIQNNSLISNANYEYVLTQIDIENYINYMISEMYFANTDWYPGNMKFWRPKTNEGKWRWILYDTDFGFNCISSVDNVDKNMINYVANQGRFPSFLFNGLIQNETFKIKFINTFSDFSNTIFQPSVVISNIELIKNLIEPEILRHFLKWGSSWMTTKELLYWYEQIDILRYFANNRLGNMKQHFINNFQLTGIAAITLDISNNVQGTIQLNTIAIKSFPWNGDYFKGVPINIEAIPKPGYKFVGWSGSITSSDRIITYTPTESNYISALFELDDQTYPVVINEINYHSADEIIGDPARPDWVEFYNNSDNPIDLSDWQFKDEGNTFIFPNNTILNGREYLVLADTVSNFQYYYPAVTKVLGVGLGFKFNNGGEALAIYSLNGTLVDTVRYNDKAPWPIEPDGDGPTLELVHPDLDNNLGNSWRSSNPEHLGTPGAINDSYRNIYDPVEMLKVVINEINYNSPDMIPARPDWIELYNNSDQTIDLSGWKLKDKDHTFLIPIGTILESRGYLVLTDTLINFQLYYPLVNNVLNDGFGFGLSSGGEILSLYNSSEILIDIVEYDVVPPWPPEPDDNGPTLELIHPDFDNELSINWSASANNYGTPGQENSVLQNKFLLSLDIFLEGAYQSSNLMHSSAVQTNDFPMSQPFNREPWNYNAHETITEISNDITDWVLVELRANTSIESKVAQRAALVKNNGQIVDLDGQSNLAFYNIQNGEYYIIIYHRNHLSIMSKEKIVL